MATKTAEKPTVKKTAKPAAEKPKAEPKKREPKAEPKFSVEDVWQAGKDYASVSRSALKDFASTVNDFQTQVDADPRTYRDHATAVKYLQRRAERIELSLTELETGLKERKKPERKPRPEKPATTRKTKAKVEEPEDVEDEDEDEDLEDEVEEEDDEELED